MKKTILCLLLILSLLFTGCTIVIVPEETQAPAAAVSGSGLTVHFVDVGQADCILLECARVTPCTNGRGQSYP